MNQFGNSIGYFTIQFCFALVGNAGATRCYRAGIRSLWTASLVDGIQHKFEIISTYKMLKLTN